MTNSDLNDLGLCKCRRFVSTKAGARIPSSPIRALSQLLEMRPGGSELDLSEVPVSL